MKAKNKAPAPAPAPPATSRASYFRQRRYTTVSFHVTDTELKERLKKVAKADHRTVSMWITTHALPAIEAEVDRQIKKIEKSAGLH